MLSDHSGLRYLFYQPNLYARQARWLATISEFDFEIRYIKGKEKKVANALIRKVQNEPYRSYEFIWEILIGFNLTDRTP